VIIARTLPELRAACAGLRGRAGPVAAVLAEEAAGLERGGFAVDYLALVEGPSVVAVDVAGGARG
jgi:hypothetical protein